MDAIRFSQESLDSSVCISIMLQVGLSINSRSIPGRIKRFLSSPNRLDRLLDEPSLLLDLCRVPFPAGKAGET
jgi:hypothetical protein